MTRALLVGALVAATSLVGGCPKSDGGEDKTSRPAKKTLVIATNSEPDLLNPLFTDMAAAREITFLSHRELTMYNDKWELVPDLAEEIPTMANGGVKLIDAEPGPDGTQRQKMQVTWRIKKDAVWSDGTAVTAEDFMFSLELMRDETQEVINRDVSERVESMTAKGEDKKILVVVWKEPYAFYDQFRVHHALPAHVLRGRYRRAGGGTADMKKDPYGKRPLANGPFKLKEWVPGQYLTFERNELYRPLPKLDEVTVRIIPNNAAIESALLAGDIQAISPSGGLSVAQVEELGRREADRFEVVSVPGLVWSHIDFNLDDPWLKDKQLRHAIAHAIDRKGLNEQLYYGKYTLAHTYLPPRHWAYNPDVQAYDYDLEKAAALLDAAGWKKKGKDGIRRDRRNKKLAIKISAVSGIRDIDQLQQHVQSDMKQIGVELVIDNKPASIFFSEMGRHRKFEHLSFYSWIMDPGSWGNTLWQSDMIPSEDNSWQGQNFPGWRNAEVTKLLLEVPTVLDAAERRKMMKRVQEIWADELPAIPMYFKPVVAAAVPELTGYRPTGTQTPVTWNAWEWDLVTR